MDRLLVALVCLFCVFSAVELSQPDHPPDTGFNWSLKGCDWYWKNKDGLVEYWQCVKMDDDMRTLWQECSAQFQKKCEVDYRKLQCRMACGFWGDDKAATKEYNSMMSCIDAGLIKRYPKQADLTKAVNEINALSDYCTKEYIPDPQPKTITNKMKGSFFC